MPSAGSYCASAVTTTTPTPISKPVTVVSKPTTVTTCTTLRGSTIKVYGAKSPKLNKLGQALYSFKLFVNSRQVQDAEPGGPAVLRLCRREEIRGATHRQERRADLFWCD